MNIVATVFLMTFVWLDQLSSKKNDVFALAHGIHPPDPDTYPHIYNDHRQRVFPSASNMLLVEYDENLVGEAEDKVSSCNLDFLEGPVVADVPYVGYYLVVPDSEDLESFFSQHLQSLSENCTDEECDERYLETIWHGLERIGCFAKLCSGDVDGQFLICMHNARSDVNTTDEAYTAGDPCGDCPGDFPACDSEYSLCLTTVPTTMNITEQPGEHVNKAGVPFDDCITIKVLDENGSNYTGKMNPACYYEVFVEFAMQSHHEARIRGPDVAPLIDGVAEFKDLAISEYGEYKLRFTLYSLNNETEPLSVVSDIIRIDLPPSTLDMCEVMEGDPQFERHYDWTTLNCTGVCLEDCKGQGPDCFTFDHCGPNAYCKTGACVCKSFLEINQFKFDAPHLTALTNPRTMCDPDRISIRVDKCGLNAIGFTLNDFYILGPNMPTVEIDHLENIDKQLAHYIQTCTLNDCRGFVTVGDYGLEYEFGVSRNFADCNALVTENSTHITYTHMVRAFGGFSSPQISRKRALAYEISCTYVNQVTLSSDFGVNVFLGSITIPVGGLGEFDVRIGIMTDSTYNEVYPSPPTILVPDTVYVGIRLEGLDTTPMVLYADHCYATPTDDPDDVITVDLIYNGCTNDSDVTIAQNGHSEEVHFSFESFTFGDQPGHASNTTLYIHCAVIACAHTDVAACTMNCMRRRRRNVSPIKDDSRIVSIGPVNTSDGKKIQKRAAHEKIYSSYFNNVISGRPMPHPAQSTSGISTLNVFFS